MSVLQALAGYYDRMLIQGRVEPPGFSQEKISLEMVIDRDGGVVGIEDSRDHVGKKPILKTLGVPASVKRTVAIVPNLFWDKTAYALGVTAGEGKRTAEEHASFRALHLDLLADSDDAGFVAMLRLLETWEPSRFAELTPAVDLLDGNVVFRLDGDADELGRPRFIHQRPAALPLIEARSGDGAVGLCLITGQDVPIARLHPSIKGVDGAQTMGAALVSFNLDAFESWGRAQGANAPTGQAAAAKYGAALNTLLNRDNQNRIQLVADKHLDPSRRRPWAVKTRHRLRLGDSTTVFWADATRASADRTASERETMAGHAELFAAAALAATAPDTVDVPDAISAQNDASFAIDLHRALGALASGKTAALGDLTLTPGVQLHILGLAPNAARLSVRFWLSQSLGQFAANMQKHWDDCRIEPAPRGWGQGPAINTLLLRTTAAQEKWDNIPPLLAGEVARAVLSGTPYPRTWLTNALMRIRAGDDPGTGWHAAVIRAVLRRLQKEREEAPMSLNKEERNPAYRLGRLFAVLETAQRNALGRVNASIRDRYFGAASATPASVFPLLLRGAQNHLSNLRKENKAGGLERDLEEIMSGLDTHLPRSLRLEDQGRFAIGYYHQRAAQYTKRPLVAADGAATSDAETADELNFDGES